MKKTLSIILAILMIVATVPFAFAAEDTPDFSDAKILTVNDEGVLCIDGVAVVCKNLGYSITEQYIPDGKYKLASDISTLYNTLFHTDAGSDVKIDLNGYTWSSKKFILYVQGSLSIYDTSAENTGKIISTDINGGILTYNGAREINLYNGTLENNDISVYRDNCVVNLYGGKIKCDTNALICHMEYSSIINIYDTVLETSDGVAHIDASIYNTDVAKAVINVADYSGDGLTIDAWIDIAGKFMLLEGIENSEKAEKYTVNYYSEFENCFLEKTEYDETTGELYVYVVANEFTQQPSAENDYTVDFNNTNATFKWYEVEETVLTPDNVTSIGGYAFCDCKGLTSITIPNSVTSIGKRAFAGCSALTSITIPENVMSIGDAVFSGCNLNTILVVEGNTNYDSRDNCNAIIETSTNTLIAECKNTIMPYNIHKKKEEGDYYVLVDLDELDEFLF